MEVFSIRSDRQKRRRKYFIRRILFLGFVLFIFMSTIMGVKSVFNSIKSKNIDYSLNEEKKEESKDSNSEDKSEELKIFENTDFPDSENKSGKSDAAVKDDEAIETVAANRPSVSKGTPVVVLDAGHGGYDVGTIGPGGSREKNNTLAVALATGSILEKKGIKVIYTRKTDKVSWPSIVKQDLLARADISNNANADLFVSIHNNSSEIKSIRGTETYYNSISAKGKNLASLIQKQIVKDVKTIDRGIRTEDYSVLRNVKAPSVIVELGYLSNPSEEKNLGSSGYQSKFAGAIAQAILSYLNK